MSPLSPAFARALVPVAFCLGLAPRAVATECDGVPETGLCGEANVLRWCADGVLMTAVCPAGELCLEDHPAFDGEANCVPIAETECEDIPPEGVCTSADNVAWCDRGEVALETCGEGTSCGWDAAHQWYDCVPSGAGSTSAPSGEGAGGEPEGGAPPGSEVPEAEGGPDSESGPESGSEPGTAPDPDSAPEGPAEPQDGEVSTLDPGGSDLSTAGPTPNVAKGGEEALAGGKAGGCGVSGSGPATGGALLVLLAVLLAVLPAKGDFLRLRRPIRRTASRA